MRSEKPSSAKPIRETRLQAVRRPRTAKPESSASEMETLRSSTEHHTKPGDDAEDITSQCRKQADCTLVLTDRLSVSIELYDSIENIF